RERVREVLADLTLDDDRALEPGHGFIVAGAGTAFVPQSDVHPGEAATGLVRASRVPWPAPRPHGGSWRRACGRSCSSGFLPCWRTGTAVSLSLPGSARRPPASARPFSAPSVRPRT